VPKPKSSADVCRILKDHDRRFEFNTRRGKGSHIMIFHPDVNGQPVSFPLTNHKGKDVGPGLLKALIRRFNLPADIFG